MVESVHRRTRNRGVLRALRRTGNLTRRQLSLIDVGLERLYLNVERPLVATVEKRRKAPASRDSCPEGSVQRRRWALITGVLLGPQARC